MIDNKRISLILPCKDEERAIEKVIKKVPRGVDEIIVVDNNSKDSTRDSHET